MDMQDAGSSYELIQPENPVEQGAGKSLDVDCNPISLHQAALSGDRTNARRQPGIESHFDFNTRFGSTPEYVSAQPAHTSTLAEFVTQRFIPEFVMMKRFAGRTHFRAILKHVLPPELVATAFGLDPNSGRDKLTTVAGWPYLDHFRLHEVTTNAIQELTSRAIEQGYSIQTATHIRNVIRSIFSHAFRTGHFAGRNPALDVTLPPPARKHGHILTFAQLATVISAMRYPEREMVLFALLTGMNVGEICGLAWKYLNLSNSSRIVGSEVIPPRTIAVRNQSHRGKLSAVINGRKRFIRMPKALEHCLTELRRRKDFVGPLDLVLVSRLGTPLHPENLAARRLKLIGESHGIPWLTWSAFYRTRLHLSKQPGANLPLELEKILHAELPHERIQLFEPTSR